MERRMGFLAKFNTSKAKGKNLVVKSLANKNIDPAQIYLKFDNKKIITFQDARHHTIVFGTTGSGKTASVIYPIIYNAIYAGHAMIIGDLKGSVGAAVRKMAQKCGRSLEVVEYGSGPLAKKVNLLAYMSEDGIRSYMEYMADDMCPDTNGKVWAKKGAQNGADIAILLRMMNKYDEVWEPSLYRINELLNNPYDASRLYTIWVENYYDKNDEKQRQFVNAVESNTFHILKKLERDRRANQYKPHSGDRTYEEQLTWNLQAIKMGLRTFLEAPGIAANFSAQGAPGIDLFSDIMAGSIILLRFDSLTGKTGTFLIRSLLSEAYKIVLKTTLEQRGGKFFHVILDEFQEYGDYSDNPGGDKNFIALGRECGACFTAATQSMSSMVCRAGNPMPVESFVGNCNNILSFYSHDSSTQQLVARYDEKIKLNKLEPGKLFAVHYDSITRKHEHGVEKLDKAYKDMCALLDSVQLPPEKPLEDAQTSIPTMTSLIDQLFEHIEAKKREEQEKQRLERENARKEYLRAHANDHENDEDDSDVYDDPYEDTDYEDDDPDEDVDDEDVKDIDPEIYAAIVDTYEDKNYNTEAGCMEMESCKNPFAEELCSAFPQFFSESFDEADIPVGWRAATVNTFHMFAATGLTADIGELIFEEGKVTAVLDGGSTEAESLLNKMLERVSGLCIICGQNIDKCGCASDEGNPGSNIPVCPVCLQKYSSPEEEHATEVKNM